MIKYIMLSSIVSMLVYAGLSEIVLLLGWTGSNGIEDALIKIVLPLTVSIFVVYFVFGLIIRVRKPKNKTYAQYPNE